MTDTKKAQEWLRDNYESKKNTTTTIAVPEDTKLERELEIDGYSELETISLENAKEITKLTIKNSGKVKAIYVGDNQITEIAGIPVLLELETLSFGKNKMKEIDVSKNTKLRTIIFHQNPDLKFANGIETLVNLASLNSRGTFAITEFLKQFGEKQLKGLAEKMGLDTKNKNFDDLKKAVEDEIDKIVGNEKKT